MELIRLRPDQITARVRALAELPMARQLGLMLGLALSVAIGVAVVLWSQEPVYRPLFSNLSPMDASEVVAALQERRVPYRVDEHSGAVLVPAGGMHETRIALAAAGLPRGGGVGFELLDGQGTFGESEFMESVRYQRVLEGELARTIASLADVRGVRVHLALPKRSLFVREREHPSASVLLELYPGRTLDPVQVRAIMHLVSSSIANLARERVTVIDQAGRLLSPEEGDAGFEGSLGQLDFTRRIESSYARRVEEILTPLVGVNRVRAQVVADVDFTIVEATEELFDPAGQSLRSEQISEQQSRGSSLAGGIPGALTNQPPPAGNLEPGGAAGDRPESLSKQATRNFEIDRRVRHVRSPSGVLQRLSVAVVIDDAAAVDKDGNPLREPLTRDQIEDLTTLVKQAVGFNEERGDTVHLVPAVFQDGLDGTLVTSPRLWEQPWLWSLAKQGLAAILVLSLALAVLRPLLRGMASEPARVDPAPAALADGSAPETSLPAPDELAPDQIELSRGARQALTQLEVPQEYTERVALTRDLISQDPRLAADIVKGWLASDR
ncbi:flagellar basal-body MS-ring/collar protein FliF [Thioalkalicoccus limnaeus]|uniref:Flagellar M-ring protein n=1 Tax=Thioalkalicoccus limnaeus TaxID=120681 RepID=A0ABV4BEW7_9GAMM